IMVKDSRKGSGANEMAIFGELAGLSTRRNVDNELFVLQARRLMVDVVDRLGLTVSYTTRSGLRTVDLYRRSPIEVLFVNDNGQERCEFSVDLGADEVYIYDFVRATVGDEESDDSDFEATAPYGATIMTPAGEIVINKSLYMEEDYIGKTISVSKSTKEAVASHYRTAMKSAVANKMSSIITISLNDIVAKRAEDVINTLIDVYNEDAVNDKQQIAEATADFIDVRLAIISKELGAVDSDIKTFKTRNSMVDIQAETEKNLTVSTKLQADVLSTESQLEMSKFIKDYLNDPEKENSLIPATGFGNNGGATNSLATQIATYNELVLRREKLLQNSSANNPVIQQLNANRVAMKKAILASLDSNIATLDIQLKNLRREQGKTDARISSVPLQEQEYLTIARQQRIKEELYLYLLNKREENAISLAITENTARIVDSAFGPLRPVAPRKSFILLIALVLGCAVPFVILYLRELLDTTVRSKHDITKFTSVPYLGDIPVYNGPRTARGVVVRANGRDNVSEAFRIVRTNMAFMNTEGQDSQVLLVTSSNQHAGKT
ncbi:MAG: chromosome partitioning protein ParA, partial [Alistipes sp.]|nr:chromosome partitioning protein ParA [Alistipes sp.]